MRYSLNIDKTINQLVPHLMGGRKLILYLQAICKPLQDTNNTFSEWASEKRIEASMTSQIIMIEWYLNRQFSRYYKSSADRMTIGESGTNGVPIYWEINKQQEPFVTYNQGETENGKKNVPLHFVNEANDINTVSFVVCSPAIDTKLISKDEYTAMVSSVIDRYKIAGKTYKILIN